MTFTSDDCALYHQTKTLINFRSKRKLNSKYLIQPINTLPVELTGTHELDLLIKGE